MTDDEWDRPQVAPGPGASGSADTPNSKLEATPSEVQFQLTWTSSHPDGLQGELIATNVGSRAWRLTGKPVITPLDLTGAPLRTQHVITAEAAIPDYVEVQPGHRARASVNWGWWDGTQTSPQVRVTWDGGTSDISATGPTHPERATRDHRMMTSSDWWRLAD